MRYRRDVPADDQRAIDLTVEHVRAHLSSVATEDDDPDTLAEDVTVEVVAHPEGCDDLVSIIGELAAEPNAPYLRDDYDPDSENRGYSLPAGWVEP